jgi:hypothetical protein
VLISLYIQQPVDLAGFPSLLLAMIQVRPTFLHGYEAAAGKRIRSFDQFVVGGNCFCRHHHFSRPHNHPVCRNHSGIVHKRNESALKDHV